MLHSEKKTRCASAVFWACVAVAVLAALTRGASIAIEWSARTDGRYGTLVEVAPVVALWGALAALALGFAATLGALWRARSRSGTSWDRVIAAGKWCAGVGTLCLASFSFLPPRTFLV